MSKVNPKYKLNSQVVTTELDPSEAVLLHLESHNYYSLNETGWMIWKSIENELDIHGIVNEIQEKYDIEADKAEQYVLALVDHLCSEKLIEMIQQ